MFSSWQSIINSDKTIIMSHSLKCLELPIWTFFIVDRHTAIYSLSNFALTRRLSPYSCCIRRIISAILVYRSLKLISFLVYTDNVALIIKCRKATPIKGGGTKATQLAHKSLRLWYVIVEIVLPTNGAEKIKLFFIFWLPPPQKLISRTSVLDSALVIQQKAITVKISNTKLYVR